MENIKLAGRYFMYLFYTLFVQILVSVFYFYKISILTKESIDVNYNNFQELKSLTKAIENYRNMFEIFSATCGVLILIFLYQAARKMQEDGSEENTNEGSVDEILTTGEIMKRMREGNS